MTAKGEMLRLIPPPITGAATGAGMDTVIAASERSWLQRLVRPRWIAAIAVVLAVVVAVVARAGSDSITVPSNTVTTAVATRGNFLDYTPVRASAQPLLTVIVTAMQDGQVSRLVARDGAIVGQGEMLAQIENAQFRLQVASEEATNLARMGEMSAQLVALRRSQLDIQQGAALARQGLIEAQAELAKAEFLRSKDIISDARIATSRSKYAFAQQQVTVFANAVADDRGDIARQRDGIVNARRKLTGNLVTLSDTLDALAVRAPIAGRLTNFRVQLGQALKRGDTVGQIDSLGDAKLVAQVDEYFLPRIAIGQRAVASLDGREYKLSVAQIFREVKNGRFDVEFAFDRPVRELRRGQSLDVSVILGNPSKALVLPNGSWAKTAGTIQVFVLNGRRAERRDIRIGRSNPEQVEILSGLSPGERVITSDMGPFAKYEEIQLGADQ